MNEVVLQSNWIGALRREPVLEGMRVRKNQSFVGQFLVGGQIEIHRIGDELKRIEKETGGSLSKAECRFVTRFGEFSSATMNKLGFIFKDNQFVLTKKDFTIRLSRINNEQNFIWKVEFGISGYMIPDTLGQMLTRLISLVKYEADVKSRPAYLRVVG